MDLPSNLPDVARAPNEFQRCQLLTIGARKTSAKAPVACALYCKTFAFYNRGRMPQVLFADVLRAPIVKSWQRWKPSTVP